MGRVIASPAPRERKDVVRNRAKLLAAADDAFAELGLEATLRDVAERAGVGVGTAYRHFATREDLVRAVFSERLDVWTQQAQQAAADPDGWSGLVRFLEDSLLLRRQNRGLREIMGAGVGSALADESRDRIAPLVRDIVVKAQRQGTLRADFDATDATFIQIALSPIMTASHDSAPDLYRRYLAVILDGMRAQPGPPSPLPEPPLTTEQTHESLHRLGPTETPK